MCSSVSESMGPSKNVRGSTCRVGVISETSAMTRRRRLSAPASWTGRVEGEDRRPDPLDRRVEIVDRELHSLRGLGIEQTERRLEREPDREELLDDRVVQIHRDALTVLEQHEVPHPRVQPRVLDRDAGRDSERHDELLVDVAERVVRALVGQVQVPEDLTADRDGHPEERPHRWVIRGEAEAVGMLAKVGKSDRVVAPGSGGRGCRDPSAGHRSGLAARGRCPR